MATVRKQSEGARVEQPCVLLGLLVDREADNLSLVRLRPPVAMLPLLALLPSSLGARRDCRSKRLGEVDLGGKGSSCPDATGFA